MQQLITVSEAAALLRVKTATVYTWAYRRQIPSQKVGKALRFKREELDRWLRSQMRPTVERERGTNQK